MAKILVVGSHAESLLHFRKEMLLAMSKHNEVIACAPQANTTVAQELAKIGIQYQPVALARTGLNPIQDLRTLRNLYNLCKSTKADQILTYTSKPVIFGSLAAKLAGVPRIFSMITGLGSYFVHSDFKSRLVRTLMVGLYKIALRFNTMVFFQNPDDIRDFSQFGVFTDPKRTVLINGSGVNLQHYQPLPYPTQISFLLTARLIKAKGIFEYLAAAKALKSKYSAVRFLLLGWFENKDEALSADELQSYIDDNTIEYLGSMDDVRPSLAQCSVFVLPSYREGTPKSVLEAMACARPIVTTDVPGCRETVVDGKNGWIVPAQDINALQIAMEKFILQPDLIASFGQHSREIAVEKYDVNKVNQIILTTMEKNYVASS